MTLIVILDTWWKLSLWPSLLWADVRLIHWSTSHKLTCRVSYRIPVAIEICTWFYEGYLWSVIDSRNRKKRVIEPQLQNLETFLSIKQVYERGLWPVIQMMTYKWGFIIHLKILRRGIFLKSFLPLLIKITMLWG